MTDEDKKSGLMVIIGDYVYAHCDGCDEWGCNGEPSEAEHRKEVTEAIWKEIKSWEVET